MKFTANEILLITLITKLITTYLINDGCCLQQQKIINSHFIFNIIFQMFFVNFIRNVKLHLVTNINSINFKNCHLSFLFCATHIQCFLLIKINQSNLQTVI